MLARSKETALKQGKRRAPAPILVTIQAQAAAKAGSEFAGYGEELFLTQSISRDFLQLPAPQIQEQKPKVPKAAPAPPTPGTFLIDFSQTPGKPPRPVEESGTRLEGRNPGVKKAKGKGRKGKGGKG